MRSKPTCFCPTGQDETERGDRDRVKRGGAGSVSVSVFFLAVVLLRQSKNDQRAPFTGQRRFSDDGGDDATPAAGDGDVLPTADFVRRRLTAHRRAGLKFP